MKKGPTLAVFLSTFLVLSGGRLAEAGVFLSSTSFEYLAATLFSEAPCSRILPCGGLGTIFCMPRETLTSFLRG